MKTVVFCCILALLCSCHRPTDTISADASGIKRLTRMSEINDIFKDYRKIGNAYYTERDFLFRGPLTIDELKAELATVHKEMLKVTPHWNHGAVNTGMAAYLNAILAEYEDGDAIYFYADDPEGPGDKIEMTRGYLLVRGKRVVREFLFFLN